MLTAAGGKALQSEQAQINELISRPEIVKGRNVVVTGTLKSSGGEYFSGQQFILSDDASNSIPVTA